MNETYGSNDNWWNHKEGVKIKTLANKQRGGEIPQAGNWLNDMQLMQEAAASDKRNIVMSRLKQGLKTSNKDQSEKISVRKCQPVSSQEFSKMTELMFGKGGQQRVVASQCQSSHADSKKDLSSFSSSSSMESSDYSFQSDQRDDKDEFSRFDPLYAAIQRDLFLREMERRIREPRSPQTPPWAVVLISLVLIVMVSLVLSWIEQRESLI